MKKILLINGHPDHESLNRTLADAYKRGSEEGGFQCKQINLSEFNFDPVLHYGYRQRTELEPDLLQIQQDITDADHLVFIYPNWWGTFPSLLKGFFDRVFLPGFAFKYRENSLLWDKLLKGRSARLIVTMDTPKWFYGMVYRAPGHHAMKKCILGFCGIKPVKVTTFGPVKASDQRNREKWIQAVEKLGKMGK